MPSSGPGLHELASELLVDYAQIPVDERNDLRLVFTNPIARERSRICRSPLK